MKFFCLALLLSAAVEPATVNAQLSVQPISLGSNTCKFYILTPQTVLSPLSSTSTGKAPYYKVFVNTGDGHYLSGDYIPNSTAPIFTYTYQSSGVKVPYAEFVEVYDDGDKPTRFYSTINLSNNLTSGAGSMTNSIQLDWARKVVSGHKNTYVVTVKNNSLGDWTNAQVKFTYDAGVFFLENGFNPNSFSAIGNLLTVTIPFLAKDAQTSVFFPLVAQDNLPIGRTIMGQGAGIYVGDRLWESVLATSIAVEESHDPNHKIPSLSVVAATGGWINYLVDFQNDGRDTAFNVHISDELEAFLLNAPIFVSASHTVVDPIPTQVAPRVWQWIFHDIKLRGLGEPGYTPDQEQKTKGWLKFRVQIGQVEPCQAIANRARIVFDCNPPIHTGFAYTSIPCNLPLPGYPFPPVDSCQKDTTWLATISNVAAGDSIPSLLDASIITMLHNGGYFCKWYPATHLTAPLDAATGVSMARPETYVLVAARNCERKFYYVTVSPGGHGADSPILVEDVPGDCVADLQVFGGEGPYKFAWTWQHGGIPAQLGANYLDMSGKTNVVVTVTDARGCSVVFSPVRGNCGGGYWWNWWYWVLLGLALVGLLFFLFQKKR